MLSGIKLLARHSCWCQAASTNGARVMPACFVLRMHTNCYFAASDQNSDIAITFSDPDFLKRSNNLAIRRRFHAVTLTFDTWPRAFVADRVHVVTNLSENRSIGGSVIEHLAHFHFHSHYVTLCLDLWSTHLKYKLNFYSRSGVTRRNSVQNLSEVEQYLAELLTI